MVSDDDENVKCKYCNNISRLLHPVCSGIEDKPFGSEMRYGRGVCDTDPIPECEINKSRRIEDNESVDTAAISIDNVSWNRYSKDSLIQQYDCEKEREIEEPFILPFGLRTLNQYLRKHSCGRSEQNLKKKLIDSCNGNSVEETSWNNSRNSPTISSMCSSMECDHLFKDSKTTHKETLKKELQGKDVKLVGPFTEPPNPGRQMKLGEPYNLHNRSVNKDFYKDF